jgi:hypothetical protein
VLKTYDPSLVDVIFAGRRIDGFGEDTFIEITKEAPAWSDKVGVDGEVTRSKSLDRRATITITLMQTSEANAWLSSTYKSDRNASNGAGVGAFRLADRSGNTVFESARTWIQEEPDPSFGREAGERVWVLRAATLETNHDGSPDV